jgi:hypothetical protein
VINTFSIFYYIDGVDSENFFLNFNEGSGELSATVDTGDYTPSELAFSVARALNNIGNNIYNVVFDRNSRSFTISADNNFSLLISSGTQASISVFELLGFTGPDLTGSSSYTGDVVGYSYEPQFLLQDFVDEEDLRMAVSASVNKSAAGDIEVVSFGTEKFFEFDLKFITDIDQGIGGVIKTNLNGVSAARHFLRFITRKKKIEFMPDVNSRGVFKTLLLESTEESSDGVGYRLKELYSDGLAGYYETGLLVFRVVGE